MKLRICSIETINLVNSKQVYAANKCLRLGLVALILHLRLAALIRSTRARDAPCTPPRHQISISFINLPENLRSMTKKLLANLDDVDNGLQVNEHSAN